LAHYSSKFIPLFLFFRAASFWSENKPQNSFYLTFLGFLKTDNELIEKKQANSTYLSETIRENKTKYEKA